MAQFHVNFTDIDIIFLHVIIMSECCGYIQEPQNESHHSKHLMNVFHQSWAGVEVEDT